MSYSEAIHIQSLTKELTFVEFTFSGLETIRVNCEDASNLCQTEISTLPLQVLGLVSHAEVFYFYSICGCGSIIW